MKTHNKVLRYSPTEYVSMRRLFTPMHKYQNLSVSSHINCIVARCLINVVYLTHVPLSGHDDVALFVLNDVTNDAESTQK